VTNTPAKRGAALGVGMPSVPRPDGTIDAADRAQLAGVYMPGAGVDSTPYQFFFETRFQAAPATPYVSNTAVIAGLGAPSVSAVVNGEQSVNGAAFTAASVAIANGDELRVRQTSSALAATQKAATATIGGVVGTFVTVTAAAVVSRTSFRRRAIVPFKRRAA
jgi:hypothetical protein